MLLRASDAHVSGDVVYTQPHDTPYAVWTAANGSDMAAIFGRGVLRVGTYNLPAFIFRDVDLTSNLLGIVPFSNQDCTATFTPTTFQISERTGAPILTGVLMSSSSLWIVRLEDDASIEHPSMAQPTRTANALIPQTDVRFVQFVHAALGYPAPTTFLNAVVAGYITGPHQYPRLTPKLVRRHMPQTMATARGHLDKIPAAPPHANSEAVSAQKRHHHRKAQRSPASGPPNPVKPFDYTGVTKSTTLHVDYTGDLPEICYSGTRCFMVSCWGSYIHLEPLTNLRSVQTVAALQRTMLFWRDNKVEITTLRMDNQRSAELRQAMKDLHLTLSSVSSYDKAANRAERAIRTAKNHIIAVRAGFHRDCPATYLDKGLLQIEMTLNTIHPYEYNSTLSAYAAIHGHPFDFCRHPIVPVGTKVLTWDAPSYRGSWADHGVPGIYMGPAMEHLRAFQVMVPSASALRVTNTVWWFLEDLTPNDTLLATNLVSAFPPTKDRPHPKDDGTDLIGRYFVESELGVCVIIGSGPITTKKMDSRAQMASKKPAPPVSTSPLTTTTPSPTAPPSTHHRWSLIKTRNSFKAS